MNIADLKIPAHIAIIMDGNARWAKSKLLPTSFGHKAGAEAVKAMVKSAAELGVKYLTIYAFSTENWQRPKEEVSYLMDLLRNYLSKEIDDLIKNDVRIFISGDLSNVDSDIKEKIKEVEIKTRNNKAICLNVAFDYGSRKEITAAVRKIASDIEDKKITKEQIDENLISKNLYQSEIPDPDLLIRTAGERRISNFLLWQIAYSELYFTEKFWPDFNKEDLYLAILDFNKRERRYGKR